MEKLEEIFNKTFLPPYINGNELGDLLKHQIFDCMKEAYNLALDDASEKLHEGFTPDWKAIDSILSLKLT